MGLSTADTRVIELDVPQLSRVIKLAGRHVTDLDKGVWSTWPQCDPDT